MIHTLAIAGYRSIRDLVLPLERLTVVTGRNGTGKSSFYKALRLLADVAQGNVISSLAAEGGLPSTLWAGPEQISRGMRQGIHAIEGTARKNPVSLKLGFASEDYGYAIDLGLPIPSASMFGRDPEIKAEAVWAGEALSRRNAFATRSGPAVTVLDEQGRRSTLPNLLAPFDSMMTHAADPRGLPNCCSCASACAPGASTTISARMPTHRRGRQGRARAPRRSAPTGPTSPRRWRRSARSVIREAWRRRWTMHSRAPNCGSRSRAATSNS